MLRKIKQLIGIEQPDSKESLILGSSINAKSAYMRTKYGKDKTQAELLKDFFSRATQTITNKTLGYDYCCMLEVDDDIKKFVPTIVKRFRDELGYNTIVINDTTTITTDGKEQQKVTPGTVFIILTWNNIDISDEQLFEEDIKSEEQPTTGALHPETLPQPVAD